MVKDRRKSLVNDIVQCLEELLCCFGSRSRITLRSWRSRSCLSSLPITIRSAPRRECRAGELRAVPVATVYGTNASGKSNVIDALDWMRSAVLTSFRRWDPRGGVPRRPFALRSAASSYPSSFAVDFVVAGVRHQFGFSVDDDRVTEEWLYYYPEGHRRRLYERGADDKVLFGRWLTGRRKLIAELLRPNSLYLSVAAAQGHEQLREVFRWFGDGLRMATDRDFPQRLDHTVRLCLADGAEHTAESAMALLRFADLGVSGLEIKEQDAAARLRHRVSRARGVPDGCLPRHPSVLTASHRRPVRPRP
ncbi:ATP/GTP-binding protein [Streptomyces sp. NPDC002164]|uniref:AAA family ATPase n=1 Tax=unclassified Streptomyces TaxID=2593676 RepID=UPI0036AFD960